MSNIEPFGYFRADIDGWNDCHDDDEGATPLWDNAALCAVEKQRDDLLAALEGLHKVCEIALSDKDGFQHTYFETRAGHFVEATGVMMAAESAIANAKGGA